MLVRQCFRRLRKRCGLFCLVTSLQLSDCRLLPPLDGETLSNQFVRDVACHVFRRKAQRKLDALACHGIRQNDTGICRYELVRPSDSVG